jgi:hypothetical protein
LDEIHYVVSKKGNKSQYTKDLEKWKNKDLSAKEIYDIIINLDKNSNASKSSSDYDKVIELFGNKGEANAIKYLEKVHIEDGLTYNELTTETNKLIKDILIINDKMIITFTRLLFYEKFTDNSFEKNEIMDKNEIIKSIKKDLNIKDGSKITNNTKISNIVKIFDDIMSCDDKHEYILDDLYDIAINLGNTKESLDNIDISFILVFVHILHKLYIECPTDKKKIEESYKKLCMRLCCKTLRIIQLSTKTKDINYEKVIRSINTYRSHNISEEINIKKSAFWDLLTKTNQKSVEDVIININKKKSSKDTDDDYKPKKISEETK